MVGQTRVMARIARSLAPPESDRELLERFATTGDQAAFATVVARHTNMVLGVCRRSLPKRCDPEDACQAVFLLLAEKAGRVRWQASVAGWLYAAARRVARNAKIAADRRVRREALVAVPDVVSPTDSMSGRELVAVLDEELDKLPPRYRDPLVLCYLEGLTQDEAATRLGVPEGTLKSQVQRGRQKLAAALIARGCELGVALLATIAATELRANSPTTKLLERILSAAAGSPSNAAVVLARGATGMTAHMKSTLLGLCAVLAIGLGLALSTGTPTSAQPTKNEPKPATEPATRIGTAKFRAARPIGDARYSADGKRIVGYAGGLIYVWDAADGTVLRTMDTKLAVLDDPNALGDKEMAFAIHPKKSLVACGGQRDDKMVMQVWDFESGKSIAEQPSRFDALKALEWVADGTKLVERSNIGWRQSTGWKLVVHDEALTELKSIDLPQKYGDHFTVMRAMPKGDEVLLWQENRRPEIFDIETGAVRRELDYKCDGPSDLGVSRDGTKIVATQINGLAIFDGETRIDLPVLRSSWEKPRPLISPDGKTAYVWDHRPIAYDTATGKEKWKATFRTAHTVRVRHCDVSADGLTLLARHGHTLVPIDTRTGTERSPADSPTWPASFNWSPDGKMLFSRATRHDRTWTAWDATTGRRLYDLQPMGFAPNDDWKMLPDLFFINDGKEIVVGIERSESTEMTGAKELLVFDSATSKCLRRLGEPLPTDTFRWMHPIAVEPNGRSVLMQEYAVNPAGGGIPGAGGGAPAASSIEVYQHRNVHWDPVKQSAALEWTIKGYRTEPPRHYFPWVVSVAAAQPTTADLGKKEPARIRLYNPVNGQLVYELRTAFEAAEPDRVQGNFLLAVGHDSRWVKKFNSMRYEAIAPIGHDLWELPTRSNVRVFETEKHAKVVLGPGAEYVLRVLDDRTIAVHEPFALKKTVTTVKVADRPEKFEFSPDGRRVAVSLADASIVFLETTSWRGTLNDALAKAVPAELGSLVDALGKDATAGLRAARLLSAAGDKGVAILAEKIKPFVGPDKAQVQQWIADLDSARFAVREKAELELRNQGSSVEVSLREILKAGASTEARERIEKLVGIIERREMTPAECREVRAVQALKWIDSEGSRMLLAKWAMGDANATLTKAASR